MIFDGREYANKKKEELRVILADLGHTLSMASILVGDDPASLVYSNMKKKMAEDLGIDFELVRMKASSQKEEIVKMIKSYSGQGIMIQLPLPKDLKEYTKEMVDAIPTEKDVDGMRWQESGVMPATVKAVMSVLDEIDGQVNGLWQRQMVVVGSSGSVGSAIMHFLEERGVYAVAIRSTTEDKSNIIRSAEVIISAVGKSGVVRPEDVDPKAIVVDVGIEKKEGRVVGDMYPDVYNKASVAVPVPGGIGPVTIISLMENLYELSRNRGY